MPGRATPPAPGPARPDLPWFPDTTAAAACVAARGGAGGRPASPGSPPARVVPTATSKVTHLGSHHRRERCCGDCLAGEHDMGASETWRTDFLFLVRRPCICADCDCTFRTVSILEPRYDQRHHRPHVYRKRRLGGRHAA